MKFIILSVELSTCSYEEYINARYNAIMELPLQYNQIIHTVQTKRVLL